MPSPGFYGGITQAQWAANWAAYADALMPAQPNASWDRTAEEIRALPVTHDCCPIEWLTDGPEED